MQFIRLSSQTVIPALHEIASVPKLCPTLHVFLFPLFDSLISEKWYLTLQVYKSSFTDISDVYWQEYFSKRNFGDLVFI